MKWFLIVEENAIRTQRLSEEKSSCPPNQPRLRGRTLGFVLPELKFTSFATEKESTMKTPLQDQPERFALKACAYCNGGALVKEQAKCPACNGKGRIKVVAPPLKCPRCGGSGTTAGEALFSLIPNNLCIICRGTGWVLTEFHICGPD